MSSCIDLGLGFTSKFLSVFVDSFDHHLVNKYHPSYVPLRAPMDNYFI